MSPRLPGASRLSGTALALLLLLGCAHAPPMREFVRAAEANGRRATMQLRTVATGAQTRKVDLRLMTPDGEAFDCYVREPLRPHGKVPAVLLLAGFETGRAALDLVEERDDLLLLAMDYRFTGERRVRAGAFGELRALGFRTIEGELAAVDYLAARPDVDASRVIVLGVSFGSIFVVPVGAYSSIPRAVVIVYGGGDLPLVIKGVVKETPWWLPRIFVKPLAAHFFDDFEPLRYVADVAPRPLLMVESTRDEFFPARSAEELFAASEAPKELVWLDTAHLDLFKPEVLRKVTSLVIRKLEARGLLDAPAGP